MYNHPVPDITQLDGPCIYNIYFFRSVTGVISARSDGVIGFGVGGGQGGEAGGSFISLSQRLQ